MIFIALTFLSAFLIEGLGTIVSVIGLSKLFGVNLIIIALAVSLDLGKLVVVSLLYKHWQKLGYIMRSYALVASIVTMVITSAGAFGYLSAEFQTAVIGTQEGSLKVEVLKKEQAKLEERKKQIDAGIAAIPDKYTARQKLQLMAPFKDEQKTVTARLTEIDKELPALQVKQIGVEAKAGPILYISKAFNISIEEAVKWVILMIIFVFDPLAVFLIIAGNFLLDKRRETPETPAEPTPPAPPPSDPNDETVAAMEEAREKAAHIVTLPPAPPAVVTMPQGWHDDGRKSIYEIAEPTVKLAGPDTSQTKVYTNEDLIAMGVADSILAEAGYEPRPKETEDGTARLADHDDPVDDSPALSDGKPPEPEEVVTHVWDEVPPPKSFFPRAKSPPPVINEAPLMAPDSVTEVGGADFNQASQREQITKSTLGLVKADPGTTTDTSMTEVGYKTGVYRTGQPK